MFNFNDLCRFEFDATSFSIYFSSMQAFSLAAFRDSVFVLYLDRVVQAEGLAEW